MKNHRTHRGYTAVLSAVLLAAAAMLPGTSSARAPRFAPVAAGQAAAQDKPDSLGATTYASQCAICHGAERKGLPPVFPSLVGVTTRLTDAQTMDIVHNGRGRMPAQPTLEPAAVTAIIDFLKAADLGAPATPSPATPAPAAPTPVAPAAPPASR